MISTRLVLCYFHTSLICRSRCYILGAFVEGFYERRWCKGDTLNNRYGLAVVNALVSSGAQGSVSFAWAGTSASWTGLSPAPAEPEPTRGHSSPRIWCRRDICSWVPFLNFLHWTVSREDKRDGLMSPATTASGQPDFLWVGSVLQITRMWTFVINAVVVLRNWSFFAQYLGMLACF